MLRLGKKSCLQISKKKKRKTISSYKSPKKVIGNIVQSVYTVFSEIN